MTTILHKTPKTRYDYIQAYSIFVTRFLDANPAFQAAYDTVHERCLPLAQKVSANAALRHYTDHSPEHIRTVLSLAGCCLEQWGLWDFWDNSSPRGLLEAEDVLVLFLCCNLHDIRLSYGQRDGHEVLEVSYLQTEFGLPEDLALRVSAISPYHSSKRESEMRADPDLKNRLLGALLRVADSLDCTHARVGGTPGHYDNWVIPQAQIAENAWQAQLDEVEIHTLGVRVLGRQRWDYLFPDESGHKILTIQEKVEAELRKREFARCTPIFEKHGLGLSFEIEFKIEPFRRGGPQHVFGAPGRHCRVVDRTQFQEVLGDRTTFDLYFGAPLMSPDEGYELTWPEFSDSAGFLVEPYGQRCLNRLSRRSSILSGPPGCGKTVLLIRSVLDYLNADDPKRRVLLIERAHSELVLGGLDTVLSELKADLGSLLIVLDGLEEGATGALADAIAEAEGGVRWLVTARPEAIHVWGTRPPVKTLTWELPEDSACVAQVARNYGVVSEEDRAACEELPGLLSVHSMSGGTKSFWHGWLASLSRERHLVLLLHLQAGLAGLPTLVWAPGTLIALRPALEASSTATADALRLKPAVASLVEEERLALDSPLQRLWHGEFATWRNGLVRGWMDRLLRKPPPHEAPAFGKALLALGQFREYVLTAEAAGLGLAAIPGESLAADWWGRLVRESGLPADPWNKVTGELRNMVIYLALGRWPEVRNLVDSVLEQGGIASLAAALAGSSAYYYSGRECYPRALELLEQAASLEGLAPEAPIRQRLEIESLLIKTDSRQEPERVETRLHGYSANPALAPGLRGYARFLFARYLFRCSTGNPVEEICRWLDGAEEDFGQEDSPLEERRFYNLAGDICIHLFLFDRAERYLEKDWQFKCLLQDEPGKVYYYGVRGDLERRRRNLELAEDYLRRDFAGLPPGDESRDHVLVKLAEVHLDLASSARLSGSRSQELGFLRQARGDLDKIEDTDKAHNNLFYWKALLKLHLADGAFVTPEDLQAARVFVDYAATAYHYWYARGYACRLVGRLGEGPAAREWLQKSAQDFQPFPPEAAVSRFYLALSFLGPEPDLPNAREQVEQAERELKSLDMAWADPGGRAVLERVSSPALFQTESLDIVRCRQALENDIALLEY